jgi:hypothetical protein
MTKNQQIQILQDENLALRSCLRKTERHLLIMVEAMSEIKATSDGLSEQPISDIIAGCIFEIKQIES